MFMRILKFMRFITEQINMKAIYWWKKQDKKVVRNLFYFIESWCVEISKKKILPCEISSSDKIILRLKQNLKLFFFLLSTWRFTSSSAIQHLTPSFYRGAWAEETRVKMIRVTPSTASWCIDWPSQTQHRKWCGASNADKINRVNDVTVFCSTDAFWVMQCKSTISHSGNKEPKSPRAELQGHEIIPSAQRWKKKTLHLFCTSCWIISTSPWQQGVWWWKEFCEIPHNSTYCAHTRTHTVLYFSQRDTFHLIPTLPLRLFLFLFLSSSSPRCAFLSRRRKVCDSAGSSTPLTGKHRHTQRTETRSLERTPLNGPKLTGKSVPLRKCKRSWRRRLQRRRDGHKNPGSIWRINFLEIFYWMQPFLIHRRWGFLTDESLRLLLSNPVNLCFFTPRWGQNCGIS